MDWIYPLKLETPFVDCCNFEWLTNCWLLKDSLHGFSWLIGESFSES
jgi:hypothetical protein